MIVLETDRLILRYFQDQDGPAMDRVFGDAEVMRFGDGVQSSTWVRNWLRDCLDKYEQYGYGPWAVIKKSTLESIGYCGLFYFPDVNGSPEVEVGYRLARQFWGQGYATEAVLAVRDYAFQNLELSRLIAMIDPGNVASIHVAEKAGMRYESDVMFDGFDHPDRVYVAVRS
ncbi:MAG: GNAT family N-acetyltransferase [Candidatus Obscuribacterales bacterium]|nr:GNAT family N-acetyltransferase [Candidatus Obscuribacterales bacterium]